MFMSIIMSIGGVHTFMQFSAKKEEKKLQNDRLVNHYKLCS